LPDGGEGVLKKKLESRCGGTKKVQGREGEAATGTNKGGKEDSTLGPIILFKDSEEGTSESRGDRGSEKEPERHYLPTGGGSQLLARRGGGEGLHICGRRPNKLINVGKESDKQHLGITGIERGGKSIRTGVEKRGRGKCQLKPQERISDTEERSIP